MFQISSVRKKAKISLYPYFTHKEIDLLPNSAVIGFRGPFLVSQNVREVVLHDDTDRRP